MALQEQGQLDEAIACFAGAVEAKPDFLLAWSNLLFAQNYRAHQEPLAMRALARRFGTIVTRQPRQQFAHWTQPQPNGPLRVGVVSGDLVNHPVGHFLEAVLGAIDPLRIELLAFPTGFAEDDLTARIRPRFRAWQPIGALHDAAAARLIHGAGVHLLLDLSGHTRYNRLAVFAWRPAPVQATWLGYFATTGLAEIDYVIGDPTVTPPGEAGHFTEAVWPLPDIYFCFTPPATLVEVAKPPMLSSCAPTFGCFNNLTKLSDATVAVWARVLAAVPDSRLLLKAPQLGDQAVRRATCGRFAAHGIGDHRLVMAPPTGRPEYLRAYHDVDIALDPFPYPGGATTAEALWMGVPVLTRRGDRFLSHVGETIARNVGLLEWIAEDDDDYVAKAVRFAGQPDALVALRSRLRAQVLASPLFDAPRFARHFEAAAWGMWRSRALPDG